jgi:hypothetical protein
MKEIGVDYEEDLTIDKMHLETENVEQASKYGWYSAQLSGAREELEIAENNLVATIARKDLYYRNNVPDGLKPTEGVYKSLVEDDREVQDMKDAVRVCNKTVNTLFGATKALEQRKGSLDNLTKLYLGKYYGETSGSDVSDRDRFSK